MRLEDIRQGSSMRLEDTRQGSSFTIGFMMIRLSLKTDDISPVSKCINHMKYFAVGKKVDLYIVINVFYNILLEIQICI